MGFLKYFTPDRMEKDIYCYPPTFFKDRGVGRVIFDIDNTIAAYDSAKPTEKAMAYLASLKENGIDTMLVSNNSPERVQIFNEGLGLFAIADAHKPSPDGLRTCMEQSSGGGKAAFVGDQIFTDCLAARRAGIFCFLVEPIQPKENLFFKMKRLGEKPFVRRYKRLMRKGKL